MLHSRIHIEANDLVIIYMSRDNMTATTITPGEIFHNKFGRYPHDNLIGQKFGSKIHSPPPQSGYIYVLRPTPELWTLSLPHRTQILYMPDIAYIIQKLGVRVGGKVVEAGTGSGSMTHSLSRTVGSRGIVASFEYHKQRCEKAAIEFESHNLGNVKLQHRNVCKDGFGDITNVEAVFLDLPAPWEAIPHTIPTLRTDITTKICCFSPCLEQVLKTVSALRTEGFSDIFTQEVLVRTHELVPPPKPHMTSNLLVDVNTVVGRLREHDRKKAARRVLQMKTARERSAKMKAEKEALEKVGEGDVESGDVVEKGVGVIGHVAGEMSPDAGLKRKRDARGSTEGEDGLPSKTSRMEGGNGETTARGVKRSTALNNTQGTAQEIADEEAAVAVAGEEEEEDEEDEEESKSSITRPEPISTIHSQILTKPTAEMRGHTSYLTFASFYPQKIRESLAEQAESVASKSGNTLNPNITTGTSGVGRVAELVAQAGAGGSTANGGSTRSGSVDMDSATETGTEYGDDTLDAVMGTMTEEEMMSLQAGSGA